MIIYAVKMSLDLLRGFGTYASVIPSNPQNAKKQKAQPQTKLAQQARVTGGQPVQGFGKAKHRQNKDITKNNETLFTKKVVACVYLTSQLTNKTSNPKAKIQSHSPKIK
jgi:hypothetical protein